MTRKLIQTIIAILLCGAVLTIVSGCALIREISDKIRGVEPPGIQELTPAPASPNTPEPVPKKQAPKPDEKTPQPQQSIDISDIDLQKLKDINIADLYLAIPELFSQIDITKIDLNNIDPNIADQIKPETLEKLKKYIDKL